MKVPPRSPIVPSPAKQPVVEVVGVLRGDPVPMGVFGAVYEAPAPRRGFVIRIGKAAAYVPERRFTEARKARAAQVFA